MSESVTLFAAFGGGLISFLSPCVLPIVPAYLSIITGLEVGEVREGRGHLRRIARDTGLFIAGFSAVPARPATMATGLAFGRLTGAFGWVKRHFTGITVASASSLAVFGVILALDRLVWVTTQLQVALDNVGLDILVELG